METIIETWTNIYKMPAPFYFVGNGAALFAYRHMQRSAKKKMLSDILELFKSLETRKTKIAPCGKNKIKIIAKL